MTVRSPEWDRAQIVRTVLRYCRAVDRLDPDGIRACYHADGIDHHTGFDGLVGDFVPWVVQAVSRFTGTMHILGNQIIELHGDVAVCESYGQAVHWGEPADDPRRNFTSGFRYVDRFEFRDGSWAIAERWAVREWTRSDAGRHLPKEGAGPAGSREEADPLRVLQARIGDRGVTDPHDGMPGAGAAPAQSETGVAPGTGDGELTRRIAWLESRLAEAEDRLALMQIIASYGPAVDSGSPAATAGIWAEDGTYDVFPKPLHGRAEIEAMVTGEMHQGLIHSGAAHLQGPPHVVIDGDTATVTHYSQLALREADSDAFRIWRTGVNVWTFARTADGWRAVSRVNRQLDGTAEAREMLGAAVDPGPRTRSRHAQEEPSAAAPERPVG